MAHVRSQPLIVKSVTDNEQLRVLRSEWQTLFSKATRPNVFLTWDWVFACCTHWNGNPYPVVLTVWEDVELRGILPLVALGAGPFTDGGPPRPLRFATPSHVDHYADVLCGPGDEVDVLRECLRWLADRRAVWNSLELCRAPDGPTLRLLRDSTLTNAFVYVIERLVPPSRCVTLPDSWDLLMRRSNHLKRLKEYVRRCVRETGAHLETLEEPAAISASLPILFELHAKRWEGRDEASIFLGSRPFWSDVAPILAASGLIKLFVLRASDGSPMAAYLVCCCRGRLLGIQTGFDPRWQKYRVGSVALALIMQFAIERGYREFDFGGGDVEYKRHWSDHALDKATIVLFPKGFAGWRDAAKARWRERVTQFGFRIADYEQRRRIRRWLRGLIPSA
jgi:CelD/BcsL family acetyltransferase involved in cellulose biosynthesis